MPNAYKNGIIRGYKVHYTEMNENGSSETEDIQPWKRSLSITGLKKFTLYNITVLAYTSKGDGVSSSKVLMTDQDGMFAILEIKTRHALKIFAHCCLPRVSIPYGARNVVEAETFATNATMFPAISRSR